MGHGRSAEWWNRIARRGWIHILHPQRGTRGLPPAARDGQAARGADGIGERGPGILDRHLERSSGGWAGDWPDERHGGGLADEHDYVPVSVGDKVDVAFS